MPDYRAMMWDEVEDLGALAHELADEEFERPSLCDGWKVRHIYGHMGFGHTTRMGPFLLKLASYKGNIPKGSFELSQSFVDGWTPAQIVDFWDTVMVQQHPRRGISLLIKDHEGFLDHLIHNQDIRRPLGRPREIPEERLVAALDVLPRIKTPLFATKPAVAGLKLVATDIDHTVGDGPEVEGPAEAIIMAAGGRSAAFADLTGDGLGQLSGRVLVS
jgi:uncharacterized protein (TIGR03083 family)